MTALMICVPLAAASAAPKRADGGQCDSVGTARKDGKDQSGNTVNCLWDTCTYTQCDTSGGTVSNCVKKTEYSNARDCKAAAARGGTRAPLMQAPATNRLKQ